MRARLVVISGLLAMAAASFANQDAGKIKEIVIRGNKRVSAIAIKSNMRVKEGQLLNLTAVTEDVQRIREMGWFSKVSHSESPATGTAETSWVVTIDVQEYDVVKEVAIVGNTAIKTEDILKVVTFKPAAGTKEEDLKPFNNSELSPTATAISKLYNEKGYFGLVEGVGPDPHAPTTVIIKIKETIVNSVTIEGLTATKAKVFQRLIKTKPGMPYNLSVWSKDYARVMNTQWFEGVDPSLPTQSEHDEGLTNLKMRLNDARTGIFNAGVVLDPANSLAGAISYSDSNFMGTGQSVGFNYTQATRGFRGSVSLDYTNPFMDSNDTTMRASLYDRVNFRFNSNVLGGGSGGGSTTDLSQYQERRTGGSLAFVWPQGERYSTGASTRFERINSGDLVVQTGPDKTPYLQHDGEVGSIALSSIRNTRDLDFDPSKGSFLRLDAEPGYAVIKPKDLTDPRNPAAGRYGFVRAAFDYRNYYTKDKRPRTKDDASREVFAFRLKGGTISGTVPFFEQYFAGGNDSVRGYSEDRFWGKHMIVGTFEWRKPIQEQFSLVGFVDYGGAWGGYAGTTGFEQASKAAFHYGYGLGIRFRTPLGPIRLDYAFSDEGKSRAHFMIGTSF
ncbi:MAG TPA: BamA/TamA family outer membrane protein [Fimbriimonas sp.]|nr:BamA/TamA family outer membrane protein [Fimbriimonas sp.]